MKVVKHAKEKSGSLVPVSRTWPPFWGLKRLQSDIDHLFEEPFSNWLTPTTGFFDEWGPVVDVYEEKNNVIVKVEIPGMKKEEIEVYVTEGLLKIAGERKEEVELKEAESYRSERYFGRFHRSVSLPAAVEAGKIEARYKDGILTVTCPKTEEAKRKQVEIKVN